ncbi:hypothetical protein GCM10028807_23300 [Spirosoma daeguense]
MNTPKFKPKTDVQEYLTNAFTYEIYCGLTNSDKWNGFIGPLEFFNLLYEQFGLIMSNLSKPLDILNGLSKLPLEAKQYYFLLDCLLKLIFAEAEPTRAPEYITSRFIRDSYEPLNEPAKFFVFNRFRDLCLDELSQNKNSLFLIFTLIEKEQSRIKSDAELVIPKPFKFSEEEVTEENPELKLNNRQGAKANMIRILSALFELHLIDTADGSELTKEKFMSLFGNAMGEDFSGYAQLLSQALKSSQETHLEIFKLLTEKATQQWGKMLEKNTQNKKQQTANNEHVKR